MNEDEAGGNWKQFRGRTKKQWGKLTDDDVTIIESEHDQLIDKIQERYDHARDQVEGEINDWEKRSDYHW